MAAPRSSKIRFALVVTACFAAMSWACAPARLVEPVASRERFTSSAMGVVVEITIDDDDADRARTAARAAQEELERIDWVLSDWKERSELRRLNASTEARVKASPELRETLAKALAVADASDGRFDPTVGPFVALWRQTRRAGGFAPTEAQARVIAEARARVGHAMVHVAGDDVVRDRPGIELDFGGIGKGYGAVRALETLRINGCPRALVAVAGDIAAGEPPRGEAGWRVTIEAESHRNSAKPDETVLCANQSVSTSGGSVQWVEIDGVRYAHIVDPRTGLGATRLAQVTVIGPLDCTVDALSTALTLVETDADAARILARFPGCRARIERDGAARWIE